MEERPQVAMMSAGNTSIDYQWHHLKRSKNAMPIEMNTTVLKGKGQKIVRLFKTDPIAVN